MLKRMFWMLALAMPLSLTAACGSLGDDLRDKIEDGAKKDPGVDPPQCKPFDKDSAKDCKLPQWTDKDGDGCIDGFVCGDTVKPEPPLPPEQCKPGSKECEIIIDPPLPPEKCKPGSKECEIIIDPPLPPVKCKPEDKDCVSIPEQPPIKCAPIPEAYSECKNLSFYDTDGDGCPDAFKCGDEIIVDPQPPVQCKPIDKSPVLDCSYPVFKDTDGDGCIDVVGCITVK